MKNYHSNDTMHFKNITLKINNLDRSLEFYRDVLKLSVIEETKNMAVLAANKMDAFITLVEDKNAKQKHTLGLYHFAILLSNRAKLAHILKRLIDAKYPITGASDHGATEALYLDDPDGNGIEIYADKDESVWPTDGDSINMYTAAMDVRGVLSELPNSPYVEFDPKAVMGHLHFHVPSLDVSRDFYRDVLGFTSNAEYGSSALFLSDKGYHHHLGTNVWNRNKALRGEGDVGLIGYTLSMPKEKKDDFIKRLILANIIFEEKSNEISFIDPLNQEIKVLVV